MIEFDYRSDIDNNIIVSKEFVDFKKQQSDYFVKKDELTKKKYNKSLKVFFTWYLKYCKTIFNNKTYDDKLIAESIFRNHTKTEHQWKEYLHKSLYVSMLYVEVLQDKINERNIGAYKYTLLGLEIDLEWLIANFEIYYKNTIDKVYLQSRRSRLLSPRDILFAANSLFYIEDYEKVEEIYLRDLKPVVMFQIRQLLEIFGKNLIGYHSIEDKDGNQIKKFTQIAWKFLKEENKKKLPRITYSFDIIPILKINDWTNSFVHTTYIYSNYIQFFALKTLNILFFSKTKGVKTFEGKRNYNFNYSDIRITEYENLKLDFESFVKKEDKNAQINWLDKKDVGAYIISL